MRETPNLKLKLSDDIDVIDHTKFFNPNMEKVDQELHSVTTQLAQTVKDNAIVLRPTGGNDRDLINNAINEVSINDRLKKVVLDGVFIITIPTSYGNGITMKSNVELEFTANSKVVLTANNYDGYYIINCNGIDNFVITNPHIVGDRDAHIGTTGEWGHGLRLGGCKNYKVYNVYVEKCWGDGVSITNSLQGRLSENGYINRIETYKCSRNGVTVASGRNITIDYIKSVETDRTLPKAALDIEGNTTGEVWENIKIGKVRSERCKGGVDILPESFATYAHTTIIDVTIGEIELIGTDTSNTGWFKIDNVNFNKIKGRIKVGSLYANKTNRALYINRVVNGGLEIEIDNVTIITSNVGDTLSLTQRSAIYVDVGSSFRSSKNFGKIYINNLNISGDAEYLLNLIPQNSGEFEKSNLRIGKLLNKSIIPCRIDGRVHDLIQNPDLISVKRELLNEVYHVGNNWFTSHFLATHYHNEGSTTNRFVEQSAFALRDTPITVENRVGTIEFGLASGSRTIIPSSLNYIGGFKSTEKGARITFKQLDDNTIQVLERVGNWVSHT